MLKGLVGMQQVLGKFNYFDPSYTNPQLFLVMYERCARLYGWDAVAQQLDLHNQSTEVTERLKNEPAGILRDRLLQIEQQNTNN